MLRGFNLLATTFRRSEDEACSELCRLLGEVGDPKAAVDRTGVAGLIVAETALSPFDVVEKLRKILYKRPYEFRYTLRIIPIEKVTETDLGEIQRAVAELSAKIGGNETFRVTVEKRFTKMSSRDLIQAVATEIEREVDLTKPDRVVLIEVVGGLTGISVIKPRDILSVTKEKLL